MTDGPMDPRVPGDEDPTLHAQLTTLPMLAPRSGLADRVLLRVRLPLPPRVRRIRDRGRSLVESGRIWFLAAPFAIGGLGTFVTVVVLASIYWSDIGAGLTWLVSVGGVAAWEATAAALAQARFQIAAGLAALGFGAAMLTFLGTAAAVLLAASAWGLYRMVRTDAAMRIPVHAKR